MLGTSQSGEGLTSAIPDEATIPTWPYRYVFPLPCLAGLMPSARKISPDSWRGVSTHPFDLANGDGASWHPHARLHNPQKAHRAGNAYGDMDLPAIPDRSNTSVVTQMVVLPGGDLPGL
jgi:hypothetical protein